MNVCRASFRTGMRAETFLRLFCRESVVLSYHREAAQGAAFDLGSC
ncbi:hypothetical protein SAMN05660706_13514 [Desulfoscipio geothermicus DSM 3669]|uniref:Uncharacterized protein n=1 Tax=Desulfoscipio geothermicus DSM 3669 TaxID=1121426 RepID=A0A1I6EC62_9FIRM|nr:hypothetical protein SAMN05660706_13514 [Desulfoscipio geothermicus DSM 3669]